jgi:hypothetical protein
MRPGGNASAAGDVGEAIAGYLRSGRLESGSAMVFLRCYAPRR